MKFGSMLRLWRTMGNLSLRQLASKVGVSATTLNRIEHGDGCDSDTMIKLINYFFKQEGSDANK